MQTLTEKRVYDEHVGARSCLVASATGLVVVRVTDTAVGEFSLVDRRSARDVAVESVATDADGLSHVVAVATEDDVLVGTVAGSTVARTESTTDAEPATDFDRSGATDGPDLSTSLSDALEPTGFGPATCVDAGPETIVAATPDGELRCLEYADGQPAADSSWIEISAPREAVADEPVQRPSVAAIDAPYVATDRGVFRIRDRTLRAIGLDEVRDVASDGVVLAGTESGLYAFESEWDSLLDNPVDAVSVVAHPSGSEPTRSAVASGTTLVALEFAESDAEPTHRTLTTADDQIVDLTAGPAGPVYAITDAGSLVAADRTDHRRHVLGVRDPAAIALVD
ncbi:hypothetical protein C479_08913 [Halovivax asiaticus JCM 14624]|uniref:HVO-0234-like beta-propeller domain-containing protein n=1 Tax=Halovivax asiaticus JCM 14624 TaxID=1227490 RepID=M0BJ88_9EURY|nr:hypothetical protein [Halovivax asiaticus]ELZ10920.1 hypothetical protein C479_08913 [Halovivax asiaticus JCM 14624]